MKNTLKLLVSISEIDEALDAFKGGADIIDIKNPKEGALGANFPWVIAKVRNILGDKAQISATIGDMPNLPGTASLAALGAAYSGANYVKVGLFGTYSFYEALYMMKSVVRSVKDYSSKVKVIASGYADHAEFGGLSPLLLPNIAYKSGADGVLIDVKNKGGLNLFDFLGFSQLQVFVNESHKFDLMVALAGGLGKEDIAQIQDLGADIIGVRRAVCEKFDNSFGRVRENFVSDFVKIIRYS
ncbi:MAG: (5-formylfuran-3-yl)methyl phosphate synthase [archaeon]|nr:(5-formylfuran-3-yl)methyl phosphate synthase [archaeon]MCP8314458.1 (5-formylfuran-3-yl)methyl phosphate synthase [archaeon]MCP8317527.1 (5-formylfuran-3-yl)methyl phosphate synthase [archaeon]MCP8320740.1 (5-formylfuran-3-yl)methyl phosphate synthase [archaeon]